MKNDYEILTRVLPDIKAISEDTFLRMRVITNSRIFGVDDDKRAIALVPIADMANHSNKENARWDYSPEDDGFYIQATRDIISGEPITFDYGDNKSTEDIFMGYGFVNSTKKTNSVTLFLWLDETHAYYKLKFTLMNFKKNNEYYRFTVKHDVFKGEI